MAQFVGQNPAVRSSLQAPEPAIRLLLPAKHFIAGRQSIQQRRLNGGVSLVQHREAVKGRPHGIPHGLASVPCFQVGEPDPQRLHVMEQHVVAWPRPLQIAQDGAVGLQFSEVHRHRLRVAVNPGKPAPLAQRLGKDAQQLLPISPVALDGASPPQCHDVSIPPDGIFGFQLEDALPGADGLRIQTEVSR